MSDKRETVELNKYLPFWELMAWQLGHTTVSQFYYTVVLIRGFNPAFAQRINPQEYSRLFATNCKQDISAHEFILIPQKYRLRDFCGHCPS